MSTTEKKRILIAVCGLTPQIITETLYALVHRTPSWIPDEIHIITTTQGKKKIQDTLLDTQTGYFNAFCEQYIDGCFKRPLFTLDSIHSITMPNSDEIFDFQSEAENEIAVDTVTDYIRKKTSDPHTIIHLSLAGGRKTLGFYAGVMHYQFSEDSPMSFRMFWFHPLNLNQTLTFIFHPNNPLILKWAMEKSSARAMPEWLWWIFRLYLYETISLNPY